MASVKAGDGLATVVIMATNFMVKGSVILRARAARPVSADLAANTEARDTNVYAAMASG